jgi:hypothetical protein
MTNDGKVTLSPAKFRESFGGLVKMNTAFDTPIYKPFMVIKENTYRETKGPCNSAGTLDGLKEVEGVETLGGCRYECDSDSACSAFTWAFKSNSAPAKCVTIANGNVEAGDEREAGTCFRKAKTAFED